jgi:hypothetical protein
VLSRFARHADRRVGVRSPGRRWSLSVRWSIGTTWRPAVRGAHDSLVRTGRFCVLIRDVGCAQAMQMRTRVRNPPPSPPTTCDRNSTAVRQRPVLTAPALTG